jgi:uncharacterized protein (TIGR03437 family)
MRRLALFVLVSVPTLLRAEGPTPSIRFAGAPSDGGQNCSTCHGSFGAANNDRAGSLNVTVEDYNPGVNQTIRVNIQHPQASRWGFEITIRSVSDETKSAGTFPALSTDPFHERCDDGSKFGSAAPCNGLREFATHVDAPRGVQGTAFAFDVPWSPPTEEIGDLRVYVAAVAADGDGTAAGDRVYTFVKTISAVGACSLRRPTLQTALNGATFQAPFSSSAMVSIFGLGFQASGRTRSVGLGDIVNNSFPTVLGCVSVQVTGPGVSQPTLLPIAYVQQDQINAQMPVFTGTGPVSITVIVNAGKPNELRSDVGTLNALQAFAPGFFIFPNSSSIAALVAGSGTIVARPAVVSTGRPVKPGEVVSLFGTGFGATSPSVPAGQLASGTASITAPITVSIGGATLSSSDVLYAGLSPGSISGLYQINVRIPASTPDGDIPVTITIGGAQTQTGATIPVQR